MSAHWGYYDSELPPDRWYLHYPIAASGHKQSPIDIDVREKCSTETLNFDYHPGDITSVVNNGHTATFEATGSNSVLTGGSLTGRYKLLQFHFHWGSDDSKGSEHTYRGKQFSAELHLVHLNTKYSSFSEALGHSDGLCVVGAFLEATWCPGVLAFDRIAELVNHVTYKNQRHNFCGGFDVRNILPTDRRKFITYGGSLTTPPLSECVQWINLKYPVEISQTNLAAFRSLCATEDGHLCCERLVNNYRPVQPLHGREVTFHKISTCL